MDDEMSGSYLCHRMVAMQILFGIDATRLDLAMDGGEGARRGGLGGIPWPEIRHVVWNFPHTGVDEAVEGCRDLIYAFLSSLSRRAASLQPRWQQQQQQKASADDALRYVSRSPLQVHVTLCNDQFGRWSFEGVARETFWFISHSDIFKPKDYT